MAKSKKLAKKDKQELSKEILGTEIKTGVNYQSGKAVDISEGTRDYKKEVALVPESERVQDVLVRNPITKKEAIVTIDRTGTTDEKLAMILLAPDANQTQKDSMLANYLFERGKESASFLAELFMSKGAHTKETRAFKTQMRRDYELVVDSMIEFMRLSGNSIIQVLLPGELLEDLEQEAFQFLKEKKKGTIVDYAREKLGKKTSNSEVALLALAIRFESEAALVFKKVQDVMEMRMRESKYGQYISPSGKIFDSSSKTFVEDIIKDIQETKEKVEKEKENEKN